MTNHHLSSFFCPTRIHMGDDACAKLPDILASYQHPNTLVVVDPALIDGAYHARIRKILESANVNTVTFSEIEPEPSAHTVEKIEALARQANVKLVLAIGGGSTIDAGKAVAILLTNGGRIHDYEGIEKFSIPPLPVIAIPTTAGTGSEVSGSCVISDTDKGLKMSIRHASLNPARHAILDPKALVTLPASVAAHAGIDAFVHALESFISRLSNPVTDAINLQAISTIAANLRPFVRDRSNLESSLLMLTGSTLAGMTFGQTGLGNVHCMARFVGAFYHLSHGLSNALCLSEVCRFNRPAAPEKFAQIAHAMGCQTSGLSLDDAGLMAIDAIEALCRDVGIPDSLKQAGVDDLRFEEMASLCVQANYNRWNPRETSKADFIQLFQSAYGPR